MPIDLPPDIPVETVSQQPSGATTDALALSDGDRYFQVYGNTLLTREAVVSALDEVDDNAKAADALASAYRDAGYFLNSIKALETARGVNLYVQEATIAELDVPDPLVPYFDQFVDVDSLQANRFRRMSMLATAHARQAGYEPIALYPRDDDMPQAITLDIKVEDGRHDDDALTVAVANSGNRFVGEYFALIDGHITDVDSNRFRAGVDYAFSGDGASEDDGELITVRAGYDRFTPWGTVDIGAAYSESEYTVSSTTDPGLLNPDDGGDGGLLDPGDDTMPPDQRRYEGETLQVRAAAGQLAFAGENTRLTLDEAVIYVDDEVVDTTVNGTVLDERYTLAELRAALGHDFTIAKAPIALGLTVSGRQSINAQTADTGAGRADASDEFASATVLGSISVDMTDTLTARLIGEYQWAFDPLPQNEEWVLGGPTRISAYLPGVLVGDQGLYSRASIGRDNIELAGVSLDASVFYEYGEAEFEERFDTRTQTIADAGVRLSTQLLDQRLKLSLVSAHPTERRRVNRERIDRLRQDLFFKAGWTF